LFGSHLLEKGAPDPEEEAEKNAEKKLAKKGGAGAFRKVS